MVVLGTYNMSFASDQGKAIGSEATFLKRMTLNGEIDRRYWNNALEHLKQFIIDHKPLAVGLQEMNLTKDGSGTGTDAVKKMLSELGQEYSYNLYSDKVTSKFGEPALSLIVNEKAGNITNDNIVIKDNKNQSGRPILMALTNNGTLLVNMHGAQNPGLGKKPNEFSKYMEENNKNELKELVEKFVGTKEVKKAYIMGDFNDRYDAITKFNFKFGDNEVVAKYDGESPASCCHNFDSMGKDEFKIAYDNFHQGKDDKEYKEANITIPEKHGITVEDYINKGDKVFAYPDSGKLAIYKSDHNLDKEVSKASDHELVYMEITDTGDDPATAADTGADTEDTDTGAEKPSDEVAVEDTGPVEGGKKSKRKTAKKGRKSKNNKSKKGGKKTKKNNSKKAKKANKSKKSKK